MSETLSQSIPLIPPVDILAFVWFMSLWVGYTLIADRQGPGQRGAGDARLPGKLDAAYAGT